jgi:hypothetical protein
MDVPTAPEVADGAGAGEAERTVIATRQQRLFERIARAREESVARRARVAHVLMVQRGACE